MKKFIETVVKNKEVFYLEVDESFAMCSSVSFYIEETNEAIPVALFLRTKTLLWLAKLKIGKTAYCNRLV